LEEHGDRTFFQDVKVRIYRLNGIISQFKDAATNPKGPYLPSNLGGHTINMVNKRDKKSSKVP
jgi:hypothetical protein